MLLTSLVIVVLLVAYLVSHDERSAVISERNDIPSCSSQTKTEEDIAKTFCGNSIDYSLTKDELCVSKPGSFSESFSSHDWGHTEFDSCEINPASGLPMMGAFDTDGNLYGTNSSSFDD